MNYLIQRGTVPVKDLKPGDTFQLLAGNSVYLLLEEGFASLVTGKVFPCDGDLEVYVVEPVGDIIFRRKHE